MKKLRIIGFDWNFYRNDQGRYSLHEFECADNLRTGGPAMFELAKKSMQYIEDHPKLVKKLLRQAPEVPDAWRSLNTDDGLCEIYFASQAEYDKDIEKAFSIIQERREEINGSEFI